jgi:hypothetical protein
MSHSSPENAETLEQKAARHAARWGAGGEGGTIAMLVAFGEEVRSSIHAQRVPNREDIAQAIKDYTCAGYADDKVLGIYQAVDAILALSSPERRELTSEERKLVEKSLIDSGTTIEVLPALAQCAWQPINTAPRDGTPIEACNSKHQSHAPVIVRWFAAEPHWCDAATPEGCALYFNPNYFDFWKPTTALPRPDGNTL